MLKILFLIHDLGQGGAEKVLVNLVNHMDPSKFDITVISLFGGGINEQFLAPNIKLKIIFPKKIPGNSKLMKLLTPQALHQFCVKDNYDIEISYLEGPSARIISGCKNLSTKLICWIHSTICSPEQLASSFRSIGEANRCYARFDKIVAVSEGIKAQFCNAANQIRSCVVLYNTIDSQNILTRALEEAPELRAKNESSISLIAVGSLKPVKGFDRLFKIIKRLHEEKYPIHLYILGIGPQQPELERFIKSNSLETVITLLGYNTNPYKYIAKSDLFICSSYSEGFSTAATEALIVGTPVCTVDVSGMKEMLGDSEYGLITKNTEEDLFLGIKSLLDHPDKLLNYKRKAKIRGKIFRTEETVKQVETMLLNIADGDMCGC